MDIVKGWLENFTSGAFPLKSLCDALLNGLTRRLCTKLARVEGGLYCST